MKLRFKRRLFLVDEKIESHVSIDNIIIKENLLEPEKESIYIFFRGGKDSGIITLASQEAKSLLDSLKSRLGLIKKVVPSEIQAQTKRGRRYYKKTTQIKQ